MVFGGADDLRPEHVRGGLSAGKTSATLELLTRPEGADKPPILTWYTDLLAYCAHYAHLNLPK